MPNRHELEQELLLTIELGPAKAHTQVASKIVDDLTSEFSDLAAMHPTYYLKLKKLAKKLLDDDPEGFDRWYNMWLTHETVAAYRVYKSALDSIQEIKKHNKTVSKKKRKKIPDGQKRKVQVYSKWLKTQKVTFSAELVAHGEYIVKAFELIRNFGVPAKDAPVAKPVTKSVVSYGDSGIDADVLALVLHYFPKNANMRRVMCVYYALVDFMQIDDHAELSHGDLMAQFWAAYKNYPLSVFAYYDDKARSYFRDNVKGSWDLWAYPLIYKLAQQYSGFSFEDGFTTDELVVIVRDGSNLYSRYDLGMYSTWDQFSQQLIDAEEDRVNGLRPR